MSIIFDSKNRIFKLDTQRTSYVFCISDGGFLEHLYYGNKIDDTNVRYIANRQVYSFVSHQSRTDRTFATSTVLCEYSVFGDGDFRDPSVVFDDDGNFQSKRFRYVSHTITDGCKDIDGLPHARGNGQTLAVTLSNGQDLNIVLYYVVLQDCDVICRNAEIVNNGNKPVFVTKADSVCADFATSNYDMITLQGMYLAERANVCRQPLHNGVQSVDSVVGATSHHANPFFALVEHNATENCGQAYGFNLVYSSNFVSGVQVDRLGNARAYLGINPLQLRWKLDGGKSFVTPQAVLTYSSDGVGGMSRNMHDFVREHIAESKFAHSHRPIVANSWEASYFDVDENKLADIARCAVGCGVDTVVLDDGWFRRNTQTGLGDWQADSEKFPDGIARTAEKIHDLGLNFGIWIEPEMVADGSELYRMHPDWILSCENTPDISRSQYVLDLTCDKVVDYVTQVIVNALKDVKLDYVKWDFNRYQTGASSKFCASGELFHRQMLGAYKLLDAIKKALPDNVLLETCSGGGGRFDLGMLYYSPQIWTSDNTDPYERLYIQYGTSLAYPTSTMSCHLSQGVCTSGRTSTTDFRYNVASFGVYGYELDLSKCTDKEKADFAEYSQRYLQTESLTLNGDLYRLVSPQESDFCAYIKVAKDKSQALLTFLEVNARGLAESTVIKLQGLEDDFFYRNENDGSILQGKTLNNVGLRIGNLFGDIRSNGYSVLFTKVK